jgi:hypothetical protein
MIHMPPCHSDPAAAGEESRIHLNTNVPRDKSEIFRFATNEHGWPMRAVEHRPVACVPSGDILRWLPISGLQTRWAHRLKVYVPLMRVVAAILDVSPRSKNRVERIGKLEHDRRTVARFSS